MNQVLVRVDPSTGDADAAADSNWSTTDETVDRPANSIVRAVRA
jgi:hypothetical protein